VGEERQPDSNASAPRTVAPHYNPTQNYPARSGSDRPARILAAAVTVTEAETVAVTGVVIAAGVAVGDGVADAIAADARRPAGGRAQSASLKICITARWRVPRI